MGARQAVGKQVQLEKGFRHGGGRLGKGRKAKQHRSLAARQSRRQFFLFRLVKPAEQLLAILQGLVVENPEASGARFGPGLLRKLPRQLCGGKNPRLRKKGLDDFAGGIPAGDAKAKADQRSLSLVGVDLCGGL